MATIMPLSHSLPLAKCHLNDLPTETLEMVLGFLDGPSSLYSLVNASKKARLIFVWRYQLMLRDVIRSSTMEVQLQKILCTIISIHQYRKYLEPGELGETLIDSWVRDPSATVTLDLSSTPSADAMKLLVNAVKICHSVEEAAKSSIMASNESQSALKKMGSKHPFPPDHLSAEEQYRIRRAFWRLYLYFEALFEPQEQGARSKYDFSRWLGSSEALTQVQEEESSRSAAFFEKVNLQEYGEMLSAFYHLRHQNGIL
ncbi:hypothetical protein ACLMJK_001311 [Lecanora helva]